MDLLLIFESALYYTSLILFIRYILDCAPRRILGGLSFLLFLPMPFLGWYAGEDALTMAGFLFTILQFPLLRLIFPTAKLRYALFFFLFMNCINVLLIGILVRFLNVDLILADVLMNLTTAAIWCVVCLSPLRHSLRQLLLYTPKHVLLVSGVLFIALILVDTSSFTQISTAQPEVWATYQAVTITLLEVAVCVAFPVFIIASASHSRLKLLTVSYEQQIHAQAEHYKALSDANWEVRRFRHDFRNTRIALEKLLSDGEQAQALTLLRSWADTLDAPAGDGPLFDTGDPIADALLTDKQARSADHSITILFRGTIPQSALDPADLCVILGNTVDNALEACQKLPPEKPRTVSVSSDCAGGFLFLTVQNPTAGKVPIHDGHIATTKGDKTLHGFGLLSLRSVLNKYDGTLHLSAEENCFTANIELCLSAPASS